MMIQTCSIPAECVKCGSDNLTAEPPLDADSSALIICHSCSAWMVTPPGYSSRAESLAAEVAASFATCPHCKVTDAIEITSGEEWCSSCGLDPNEMDYPPNMLAHLWRKDSGIRDFMSGKGKKQPRPSVTTRMYRFLVNYCGPHCVMGKYCSQDVSHFGVCMRREAGRGGDPQFLRAGGLRNRLRSTTDEEPKETEKAKETEKVEQKRYSWEKGVAVLECASSGWYERKMKRRNEATNPQGSTHTGGGSGT